MRRFWVVAIVVAAVVAVTAVVATRDDAELVLAVGCRRGRRAGRPGGRSFALRDGDDVTELGRGDASADDRFRVGSVTKTFVAALTLALVDAGVLRARRSRVASRARAAP